jgi:hypothetical protein
VNLELPDQPNQCRRKLSHGGHIIYLFCGSNAGGERAAAIYSLLGSAKLNGLDPELYLHQVLERIADHPISRITELLPWNLNVAKAWDTPK